MSQNIGRIYGKTKVKIPSIKSIPQVNSAEIAMRAEFIKQMVIHDGFYYFVNNKNIFKNTDVFTYADSRVEVDRLDEVDEFVVFQPFKNPQKFKFSAANVLAQLPETSLRKADVFEVVETPTTMSDALRYDDAYNNHYHVIRVKTYKFVR